MVKPLTEQQLDLIELYSECQLGMTPKQFYAKWQVNYELIATICVSEAARSASLTCYRPPLVYRKGSELSPS